MGVHAGHAQICGNWKAIDSVRASSSFPLMPIRRMVSGSVCVLFALGFAVTAAGEDILQNLPVGVYLQKRTEVGADQRKAFGQKLGGAIEDMNNSVLQVQGRPIQANVITAASAADAEAIWNSLLKIKGAAFCVRKDRVVVEFAGKDIDTALATKTTYELKLMPKPSHVRYRVMAELLLVDQADYMACNALFEKYLEQRAGDDKRTASEIEALVQRFKFGKTLTLRHPKLNESASKFSFETTPDQTEESGCGVRYHFLNPPVFRDVPYVKATLEVSTNDSGFSGNATAPDAKLIQATPYWPVNDVKIKELAAQITTNKSGNDAKASAILAWLAPGKNLRYTGVTGSRWGTLKVLEQKFGHCWDFSDCFVTLCRAAGVPCRQVAGWLFGSSGHVWAEYYREGKGWQQVDPTGGGVLPCGIYHIAYFTSEDGEMPIVYLAMPKIEIVETDYAK